MLTRREALLAAAASAVIAGCGGRPARTIAGDPRDLKILAAALDSEREQVAVYEAGLKLRESEVVRRILEHQRAHVSAIKELIRELGGRPGAPQPVSPPNVGRGFDGWRQDTIKSEARWSSGYAAVLPKLVNPRLRATVAALATSEAEHAVALDYA